MKRKLILLLHYSLFINNSLPIAPTIVSRRGLCLEGFIVALHPIALGELGPINKISCFTSFHSRNAHVAGGYLYLLFNLRPSSLPFEGLVAIYKKFELQSKDF